MTSKKNAMATTLFAAGGTTLLLLAGCGGSDSASGDTDDGSGAVYEFQTNGIDPADEIRVNIPDDLKEVMDGDKQPIVNGFTVRAHELDSSKYCAADLDLDFADGQPAALNSETDPFGENDGQLQKMIEAVQNDSVDGDLSVKNRKDLINWIDEDIKKGKSDGVSEKKMRIWYERLFGTAVDFDADTQIHSYRDGDSGEDVFDRYIKTDEQIALSETETIAKVMGSGPDSTKSTSELDEANPDPETGTYVSDDLQTMTVVSDCAASATDPDNAISVKLRSFGPSAQKYIDGNRTSGLAEVQISVVTDGTIGVSGEVDDYMRDANDNWIEE